jgi:hypothetical protein
MTSFRILYFIYCNIGSQPPFRYYEGSNLRAVIGFFLRELACSVSRGGLNNGEVGKSAKSSGHILVGSPQQLVGYNHQGTL